MTEPAVTPADDFVLATRDGGWRNLWTHDDWLAIWLGGLLLAAIAHFVWHAQPADFSQRLTVLSQRKQELSRVQVLDRQYHEQEKAIAKDLETAEKNLPNMTDASPDQRARQDQEQEERRARYKQSQSENDKLYDEIQKLDAEKLQKQIKDEEKKLLGTLTAPFKGRVVKPQSWDQNPVDAVYLAGKHNLLSGLSLVGAGLLVLFAVAQGIRGESVGRFAPAFCGLFLLAILAYLLANQKVIKFYNLEYPLWGLLVGLSISNILGTPAWLKPAVQTELYIKTGLVLLGAEVLFSQLLQLGLPGIFISWVTTPIVLIGTFLFGQYVLKIPSKTLNIVIAADMSVCGVSAAIATAAACRAKKSELSLAIGLSLGFTVIMMIVMPICIQQMGMDPVLGGAWIGGTIDATGAVAAAGESLGPTGLFVATTVKMIQNILIGVIAFGVAVYWAAVVERGSGKATVGMSEIWRRFPKFVLGFVLASAVFSYLYKGVSGGPLLVDAVKDVEKTIREWLFCLAFVSIGLESNLKEFRDQLRDGKALTLYVLGQAFNLVMTLFMAWLMFYVVFPDITKQL